MNIYIIINIYIYIRNLYRFLFIIQMINIRYYITIRRRVAICTKVVLILIIDNCIIIIIP